MISIGQKLPDFNLDVYQNDNFSKIKLDDFKGKWLVLLFYPADFTFVCPTELSDAQRVYEKFRKINAEIVSVSTDTHFTHKAWHDSSPLIKAITYPMAADPTGNFCRTLGTYKEDDGSSWRASFIVDPEGMIKAIDIHDNSIGRSIDEILRKLQASQYVAEHQGEVCPASWKPGEKTLKPGADLVGKL